VVFDWADVLAIPVRIVTIYAFALILIRVMGKRELDRLTAFDFVIAVALGEIIGAPMIDTGIPLWHALVAIVVLGALEIGVSYTLMKSPRLKSWVHGTPTVVIENSHIVERNLLALRYNLSDLLAQLREKGYTNVADVEFALLENSGRLTVFPKSQMRPLQPRDLGIHTDYEGPSIVVVMDGNVQENSLKRVGLDRRWLEKELAKAGISDIKHVLLATLDSQGELFIDRKDPDRRERIDGSSTY